MIPSHLLHMLVYSALSSVAFAFLTKDDPPARVRYGLKLFGIMTLGSILLAWLMYPFPRS